MTRFTLEFYTIKEAMEIKRFLINKVDSIEFPGNNLMVIEVEDPRAEEDVQDELEYMHNTCQIASWTKREAGSNLDEQGFPY